MNQENNVKTIPEQTVDLFANANDISTEMIDNKRIQESIAEQRLIAALDVELQQLYSLTMFHRHQKDFNPLS